MSKEVIHLREMAQVELNHATRKALDAIKATDRVRYPLRGSLYYIAAMKELWRLQQDHRAALRTEIGSHTGENNVDRNVACGMRERTTLKIHELADELLGGVGKWGELQDSDE